MFDLKSRVAIVTGGSRGIGRAAAVALASRGARVVVGYASGQGAAEAVVEEIRAAGGAAEAAALDVSSPEIEPAIAEIAKRLGRLDVLVASAGVSVDGLLLRLKSSDLDRLLDVNLKGAIYSARAALKVMMRARYGRVILLSSVVGETGNAGQTAYAATKAGLIGAAKSLAREYASRGITVNAISPGFVETDMTRALTDEQRQGILQSVPMGRIGSAEEIAAGVVYLASEEAGYITGHSLRINGGMYM
ncbi:MAG: 3-oxoacyl-ACP reductase FabG [Polyangiaceae bacterium]|nr:3-oxoacyl-ACP reductase FabG [Polyangiaceae bacterium]MCW5791881.1 3-oxoacyl-ACP reductase FabG [Polyangiaceae bacterium]